MNGGVRGGCDSAQDVGQSISPLPLEPLGRWSKKTSAETCSAPVCAPAGRQTPSVPSLGRRTTVRTFLGRNEAN